MKTVFLICGQSGSGKDTIANLLKQYGLKVLCSYTTRPRREGEGDTHTFIQSDEVEAFKKDMIAYTKFDGHDYFATMQQLKDNDIYIIDPDGIEFLKSKVKDINFVTIYIYVTLHERIERMSARGDSSDKILQRVANDQRKFRDIDFDYAIKNMNLEKSVQFVKQIIDYETGNSHNLDKDIDALIDEELQRAVSKYGAFHSSHEGYSVLNEEWDEMVDAGEQVSIDMDLLWGYVKNDDKLGQKLRIQTMQQHIKKYMLEAIQVGAMIKRFMLDLNK